MRQLRTASSQAEEFVLLLSCNLREALSHINIYFGSNAEFRQVNSRFDRETGSGNHAAVIVRFQIVHVRSRPMDVRSNAVPGAVKKIGSEAAALDIAAGHVVHFVSGK